MLASTLFLCAVGPATGAVTQMRHSLFVEGRPNCARQSLASALLAPCVAATSYCDPGRHARSPPAHKNWVSQIFLLGAPSLLYVGILSMSASSCSWRQQQPCSHAPQDHVTIMSLQSAEVRARAWATMGPRQQAHVATLVRQNFLPPARHWIFYSCFIQGKSPKIHQEFSHKIHPEAWSEKFPLDFCRSLS